MIFTRPLNSAAMVFCAPVQKHKIGNASTRKWVLRSNERLQDKEAFNIYELNNNQHQPSLNIDAFQSSHVV